MRTHPSGTSAVVAVCISVILVACGSRLPAGFDSLTLTEKVAAYETHLGSYGRPSTRAEKSIAKHGVEAALAMLPYVRGDRVGGLTAQEALVIIDLVQSSGHNLRGTIVEYEIERFLARSTLTIGEQAAAKGALESIRSAGAVQGGGRSR